MTMPRGRFIGPSLSLDHGTLRISAARRIGGHHRLPLAHHPLGRFPAMTHAGIRLRDVTIAYNRHPAVHHLDGTFSAGSLTAVTGPNGAGKSTLLKAVMGELPLASGAIERDASSVTDIAYLPQAAEIDRRFPLTVGETVLLGAWRQAGAFGAVSTASASEARRALATVGLEGFERRHIGSLSAGQ